MKPLKNKVYFYDPISDCTILRRVEFLAVESRALVPSSNGKCSSIQNLSLGRWNRSDCVYDELRREPLSVVNIEQVEGRCRVASVSKQKK